MRAKNSTYPQQLNSKRGVITFTPMWNEVKGGHEIQPKESHERKSKVICTGSSVRGGKDAWTGQEELTASGSLFEKVEFRPSIVAGRKEHNTIAKETWETRIGGGGA